jgi:oxaloacetate decarboxylase alpha subunit
MVEKRVRAGRHAEALRLIEEMLQVMEQRSLSELDMEYEGLRVRLKRGHAAASQVVEFIPGAAPAPASAAPAPAEGRRVIIKSPMVGTFYRAPASEAPAFVEVGQDVEASQVVCIIEAMKLMNEIKAEVAGRVMEVLVENGAPVEYGQPLFAIEPTT